VIILSLRRLGPRDLPEISSFSCQIFSTLLPALDFADEEDPDPRNKYQSGYEGKSCPLVAVSVDDCRRDDGADPRYKGAKVSDDLIGEGLRWWGGRRDRSPQSLSSPLTYQSLLTQYPIG
jgi:hypothetical protein